MPANITVNRNPSTPAPQEDAEAAAFVVYRKQEGIYASVQNQDLVYLLLRTSRRAAFGVYLLSLVFGIAAASYSGSLLLGAAVMIPATILSCLVVFSGEFLIRNVFSSFSQNTGTPAQTQQLVVAHAIAVFGDEQKARHWLNTPLPLFGDRAPATLLRDSPANVPLVEQILTRIEHNIPS
jgi:putative toxin-antitoxin system antitoxin component (TIGR02293 family)